MSDSTFVYVTYIRTTPAALWTALTTSDFTRQYWFGVTVESDWSVGSPWQIRLPDGRVADAGEILVCDAPRQLVIKWRNEFMPELKAEGYTRCTMLLEAMDGERVVKLTITHGTELPDAKVIKAVSGGWPKILSNLKSLLETGEVTMVDKP